MRTAHRTPEMIILALLPLVAATSVRGQSAGQNVNMVSGTGWTNGEPFLQRRNKPSMAVSKRNPAHLFAGTNDFRSVDLPRILGTEERGGAWRGTPTCTIHVPQNGGPVTQTVPAGNIYAEPN